MKTSELNASTVPPKTKSRWRENLEAIVLAIILALFIRTFVVQAFKIPSGSMKETLQIGDHILVNKFIYGVKLPWINTVILPLKEPQREDILVFEFPEDPKKDFIKRVVGLEGDVIEIRNKRLFVNNELQDAPYSINTDSFVIPGHIQPRDNFGPYTVPANSLFVLGDNRDHSYDSRFWGVVDISLVKGKAFIIYWSWDRQNVSVRWNRLGNILR